MALSKIRIGSRGSPLALVQVNWVKRKLEERFPDIEVETTIIKTSADRFLSIPLQAIGGKGVFVKEIEEALLEDKIDVAVHSMKDLPTEIPDGLVVAVITEREDPRDVLICRQGLSLKDLPPGARVGTGSLRRQTQILHHRPDLKVVPIRGNVDTRLKKLDGGEVDALVMAAAGLNRLGQAHKVSEYLSPEVCLSAVAQGALALETRGAVPVAKELAFLHHDPTAGEVTAERAFLRGLGGGCQVPIGARGYVEGKRLKIMGVVGDTNGKRLIRAEVKGQRVNAETLGEELARRLIKEGAEELLISGQGAPEEIS